MFVIEQTFDGTGRAYVVARAVDAAADFAGPPDARPGGCPVERWLDMPRVLDPRGRQRMDLFGFCLKNVADRARLRVGDRVALE